MPGLRFCPTCGRRWPSKLAEFERMVTFGCGGCDAELARRRADIEAQDASFFERREAEFAAIREASTAAAAARTPEEQHEHVAQIIRDLWG